MARQMQAVDGIAQSWVLSKTCCLAAIILLQDVHSCLDISFLLDLSCIVAFHHVCVKVQLNVSEYKTNLAKGSRQLLFFRKRNGVWGYPQYHEEKYLQFVTLFYTQTPTFSVKHPKCTLDTKTPDIFCLKMALLMDWTLHIHSLTQFSCCQSNSIHPDVSISIWI